MKVLFTDIDGVLNVYFEKHTEDVICESIFVLLKSRLDLFANIVKELGLTVVLSSAWRLHPQARTFFCRTMYHKYKIMVHKRDTPSLKEDTETVWRMHEIQKWLDESHEEIEEYLIIDDTCISNKKVDNFLRIDYFKGLTQEDCDEIRKHFSK